MWYRFFINKFWNTYYFTLIWNGTLPMGIEYLKIFSSFSFHLITYMCCIAICRFMQNTTTQWRRRHSSYRKIYVSLYLKSLCVRGSWRPKRTATYWPPLLWPSALCLSRSPGLLNRRPSSLLDAGFLYHILSPTGLVSKTHWLPVFTELYNSSIAHSISLEWHVWSSSSGNNCHAVHRSLSSGASVYDCTMGFYLVPYCQPSPPTRFLPITAIGMCHFLPVHHFGMTCLAGSKVNIQHKPWWRSKN